MSAVDCIATSTVFALCVHFTDQLAQGGTKDSFIIIWLKMGFLTHLFRFLSRAAPSHCPSVSESPSFSVYPDSRPLCHRPIYPASCCPTTLWIRCFWFVGAPDSVLTGFLKNRGLFKFLVHPPPKYLPPKCCPTAHGALEDLRLQPIGTRYVGHYQRCTHQAALPSTTERWSGV